MAAPGAQAFVHKLGVQGKFPRLYLESNPPIRIYTASMWEELRGLVV